MRPSRPQPWPLSVEPPPRPRHQPATRSGTAPTADRDPPQEALEVLPSSCRGQAREADIREQEHSQAAAERQSHRCLHEGSSGPLCIQRRDRGVLLLTPPPVADGWRRSTTREPHEQDQRIEHGPHLGIAEILCGLVDVVAERRKAKESEDCTRSQCTLQPVERKAITEGSATGTAPMTTA